MIGSIIVMVITAVCAAIIYTQASIVRGVISIVMAIAATILAFNYFETLAAQIINRGDASSAIVPWAQPVSLVVVFLLAFILLMVAASFALKQKVDFGKLPEQIGRLICGIMLGLTVSGVVMTAMAMAPLPSKMPYQRFEAANPNADDAKNAIPNTEGLTTGLFSLISKGSMSGKQSFATLHPDFIDQLFLNRHAGSDIHLVTSKVAIVIPKKNGVWSAPEGLKDTEGNAIQPKPGHTITVARLGINGGSLSQAGKFTLSQVRLICKDKASTKATLAGAGINAFPIGYLQPSNTLEKRKLNEVLTVSRQDFEEGASSKFIDFAFNVPNGFVPVLLQFKGNNIGQVSPPASPDQVPQSLPFKSGTEKAEDNPGSDNSQGNQQPQSGTSGTGLSPIGNSIVGPALDEDLQLQ